MPDITVAVTRVGDTTTSRAQIRTHAVAIDRPEAKGGGDQGPMGGELLLASLGGCFMSNLIAALQARELPADRLTATVTGTLDGQPARFQQLVMEVSADGLSPEELTKAVTIAERGCIVANTLKPVLPVTIRTSERS